MTTEELVARNVADRELRRLDARVRAPRMAFYWLLCVANGVVAGLLAAWVSPAGAVGWLVGAWLVLTWALLPQARRALRAAVEFMRPMWPFLPPRPRSLLDCFTDDDGETDWRRLELELDYRHGLRRRPGGRLVTDTASVADAASRWASAGPSPVMADALVRAQDAELRRRTDGSSE